jgi:hypothetical protein
MNTEERLVRSLRGLGSDQQLMRDLMAEKEAQIEGATVIIKPLLFIAVIGVFALCFWQYELGLLLSTGAAILTVPAVSLGVCLPVGRILGTRAARRYQHRLLDEYTAEFMAKAEAELAQLAALPSNRSTRNNP